MKLHGVALFAATFTLRAGLAVGGRISKRTNEKLEVPRAGDYTGYAVLKAMPKSQTEVDRLSEKALERVSLRADFWVEPSVVDQPVIMMFDPSQKNKAANYFEALNISYSEMMSDVQANIAATTPETGVATAATEFALDQYHTFDAITSWIQKAASLKSSGASAFVVGKTSEGRVVTGLKIGNPQKPVVFLLCGMHSREWAGTASCIYVADQLMRGAGGAAFDAFEWHIVPVANADGYEFTWKEDRMWHKTRRSVSWFCKGVDPNRNYDWKHCQEKRERSCNNAYCGKSAFSEPEVDNVAKYVQGLMAEGREVKAFLDVHAFSQMWTWPWGASAVQPEHAVDMAKCGNAGASALEKVYGTQWQKGTIANTINKASGSSVDWSYGKLGITYSYALELSDTGSNGFLLPADQIIPSGKELLAGLGAMATCISGR